LPFIVISPATPTPSTYIQPSWVAQAAPYHPNPPALWRAAFSVAKPFIPNAIWQWETAWQGYDFRFRAAINDFGWNPQEFRTTSGQRLEVQVRLCSFDADVIIAARRPEYRGVSSCD